MSAPVAILANPLSGRDVRRMVARASTTTNESKRDQVARVVVGAVAAGADHIIVMREPFRISTSAVENLRLNAKIEILDVDARLHASDTVRAVEGMRAAGAGALVVLGGDGTHRIVTKAWPDAPMMALSTGTNNVFPNMVEATSAGAAAGLVASGRVSLAEVSERAKLVHVEMDGEEPDLAVIDAVFLVDDRLGNFTPFEPDKLRRVILSRAEPAAVGISPIGGLLQPCSASDDFGVDVACSAAPDGRPLRVPISPGLFRTVRFDRVKRLDFGEPVTLTGPGILAFDGDRARELGDGQTARICVRRDGPHLIDVDRALRLAADRGLYLDPDDWQDAYEQNNSGDGPGCC